MPCQGELRAGGGCYLGNDCSGHGTIDCQICGRPVADHPLPKWGDCKAPPVRTPRPPHTEGLPRTRKGAYRR